MKLERDWEWEDWDQEIRCVWVGTRHRARPAVAKAVEEIPDDPETLTL